VHTKAIGESLRDQRRKQALTAIEELPEHLEEVLQQSATNLFEQVQDKVAVMSELIRDRETSQGGTRRDKAVKSLEAIPDIMWGSFESNVAKAKDEVRQRIEVMMKGLGEGTWAATDDEIVQEMRALPAEVQQITEVAIQAAVEETNFQAEQQFQKAIDGLPEECDALRTAKRQVFARVQGGAFGSAEHATRVAAFQPVEQAVAAVKGNEEVTTVPVANQVVADILLRAKAARAKPEDSLREMTGLASRLPLHIHEKDGPVPLEGGLPLTKAAAGKTKKQKMKMNPGSVGHPELCPRPCLYFPVGECVNGAECEFCHLPHPKRPSHLDKRHREMLRQLAFSKFAGLVMPVLKEKVFAVDASPETIRLLDCLGLHCDEDYDGGSSMASFNSQSTQRSERQLVVALKSLSLRSLLTSLHRSTTPHDLDRRQAVDSLLQHLRYRSMEQEFRSPALAAGVAQRHGFHSL